MVSINTTIKTTLMLLFNTCFEEWKTSHDVWFTECSTQLRQVA